MTKTRTPAWRLDALDPLGGLAFASFRISELEANVLDAGIPAVFVSAPTFQPVNLTNRSVGLAATRRSFQAGLFIKGAEVSFPDLEDAIEFVRRCYVRGGGGAGSGPGGGPPPPLPEGGPEFPGGPTFEGTGGGEGLDPKAIRLSEVLRSDLQEYSSLTKGLDSYPPGQSFSMKWSQPSGPPPSSAFARTARSPSADGADVLTRGAVRLLDEMIRRVPDRSTDAEEVMNWLVAYRRLALAICKMGIWPLGQRPPQRHLQDMFDTLHQYLVNRRLPSLFNWNWPPFIWDLPWHTLGQEWTDAIDDLHQWPVPSHMAKPLSSPGNNKSPTMLNFLAAFLANPPALNGSLSPVPEIDLALFAAARIVAPCARNWRDHAGDVFYLDGFTPEIIGRRTLVQLAESAWAWLVEQLPRRGFGSVLEQVIAQTSSLVAA